jgi:hypothetical protein
MQIEKDIIGLRNEELSGERLLEEIMRDGKTVSPCPKLPEIRERLTADLAAVPESVKKFRDPDRLTVEFSPQLQALRNRIAKENAEIKRETPRG